MIVVDPHEASDFSKQTRNAWVSIAYGHRSPILEEQLGRPIVGDHLPGLGELAGWGLVDRESGFSGAIYTGFYPNPTMVDFLLSARVSGGDRMSLEPLDRLAQLPAGILEDLHILSLTGRGPAIQIRDRAKPVLDTLSRAAQTRSQKLVRHLVAGSVVTTARVDTCSHPAILVTVEGDRVTGHREHRSTTSREPGWVEIIDWDDGPA
jgi:hypothetical protein